MLRCLELAKLGSGKTAPNPMVGAVLVYHEKIIGEGYHHGFGNPHAEVNAINNAIGNGNKQLLNKSSLYISLEPCVHFGNTPPCTDLIISHKIPKVFVGCLDPFPKVNGSGIKKMLAEGIDVQSGILEKECVAMNRRFITFHTKKRPYIILKFAQTSDRFIAPGYNLNKKISNNLTDILVHKWRSEESAILIGTKTAEADNPFLTVRKWQGDNPLRIVIDKNLRLLKVLNIFNESSSTIVFNSIKNQVENNVEYIKINFEEKIISQLLHTLYERKIISVIVEGGSNLLTQFIENKLWDEARVITSDIIFHEGIRSPVIAGHVVSSSKVTGDRIDILHPDIS